MRARTIAVAALATSLAGCGPMLFVGNEVAVHQVAIGLIKQLLAGKQPDISAIVNAAMKDSAGAGRVAVRSDITKWIHAQKVAPEQTAALMQLARATQASLTVDVKDPQALQAVAMEQVAAVQCVARRGMDVIGGQPTVAVIAGMTVDTPAREALFQTFSLAVSGLQRLATPIGDGCA